MSNDLIIETQSLTKRYGSHVALADLNLKVRQGATGLLGPNGAGKSTFLKTILGLIQATSGSGSVLGHDIRAEADRIRSRIGYMAEYEAMSGKMTAYDQVRYSGELLGMNVDAAISRAHEALDYVGLGEQRYRKVETYSTGMKQAAKLACALIHDPEMIIADEPTNGLDLASREFMLTTLDQVVKQGGRSVIMASHLMDDVERVCDRMVLLHGGRLVAQGRIEDLKGIDREVEVQIVGHLTGFVDALRAKGRSVRSMGRTVRAICDDEGVHDDILRSAVETGTQIRRLRDHEASLEDLFIVIMERLGYGVKRTDDLGQRGLDARSVDVPSTTEGVDPVTESVRVDDAEFLGESGAKVTGLSPMEVAWAPEGVEGQGAIAPTMVGAQIFEQVYRPWRGTLNPRWARNYAIFRHHALGLVSNSHYPWGWVARIVLILVTFASVVNLGLVLISGLTQNFEFHSIFEPRVTTSTLMSSVSCQGTPSTIRSRRRCSPVG